MATHVYSTNPGHFVTSLVATVSLEADGPVDDGTTSYWIGIQNDGLPGRQGIVQPVLYSFGSNSVDGGANYALSCVQSTNGQVYEGARYTQGFNTPNGMADWNASYLLPKATHPLPQTVHMSIQVNKVQFPAVAGPAPAPFYHVVQTMWRDGDPRVTTKSCNLSWAPTSAMICVEKSEENSAAEAHFHIDALTWEAGAFAGGGVRGSNPNTLAAGQDYILE